MVSQLCPSGGVPVVSSGVPVVFERWCPGRVSVVVEWCPSRAPVVSRWCSSGVHWRPGRVPVLSCAGGDPPGRCPGTLQGVPWLCAGGWRPGLDHHFGKSAIVGRLVFCW